MMAAVPSYEELVARVRELEAAEDERTAIHLEMEKLKKQLAEAQELAGLGYWHWDIKSGRVEWSPQVFKIFHLDPAEFTPQIDSIMSLSPWPEENRRHEELMQIAVVSHERGEFDQKFLYPDGTAGYYHSTFQGRYDKNGELSAIEGTVIDITARKTAEESLRQAQKMESVGRLAGGIAHDLNNLLTPIIGYADLLVGTIGERDELMSIIKAGKRARDLITQLLAFGRRQTLRYESIDPNMLIRDFNNLLRHTIREDVEIQLDLSPDVTPVWADAVQIEQVIMNLCTNARDAMASGGVLRLSTGMVTRFEDNESYVGINVSDTGDGMDESIKNKIFEPFFSTKGEMGTGLGLATAYGIVSQHGGTIEVETAPGKGSTFTVLLPASTKPTSVYRATERKNDSLSGSETILIVEDNDDVRQLAGDVLSAWGYTVFAAGSGAEARSIIERDDTDFSLVITDVIMPEMNGKELYDYIRGYRPQLRVLFMSGYTDRIIAETGGVADSYDIITKPFSAQALLTKVREVIDR